MSNAYIFFSDGFEEIEALAAVDVLRRGDVSVNMVSVTGNVYVTGSHGIEIKCDSSFEDNDYSKGEVLVLPGGMPGTNGLMAHEGLKKQLFEYKASGKYLAAICAAPSVLGVNGLLEGREATCFPGFEDKLVGAKISEKKVVTDGKVITAKGMGVATEFGLAILEALSGRDVADRIAAAIQYK